MPKIKRIERELLENSTEIIFFQKNDTNVFASESICCIKHGDEGNVFKIAQIPLTVRDIAVGDIIKTEYNKQAKRYYFEYVVARSGNSTFLVECYERLDILETKPKLEKIGCTCRICLAQNILAVNVPKSINYYTVFIFLDTGKGDAKWKFECLYKGHIFGKSALRNSTTQIAIHVKVLLERVGVYLKRERDIRQLSIASVSNDTGIDEFIIFEAENGNGEELGLGPFLTLLTHYGSNPADALK